MNKNMRSQKYWKKRMDEIFAYVDQTDYDFFYELQSIYSDSAQQIQKEIFNFYSKYAKENEISYQEAKKRLMREDLSDYRNNAKKYFKQAEKDPELLNRLNEQYQAGKVTRLEALNLELEYQMGVLNGNLHKSFDSYLKDTAKYAYRKVGQGLSSSTLNKPVLEQLVKTPFNGRNYSESIWGNTDELAKDLKAVFKKGFVRGQGPADMARELRKKYNVAKGRAETIVRTDGTNIINNATAKRYMEAGLTKYQFHAHIDNRTTQTCRDLNKKTFLLKDFEPGVNAPPMHYRCRSTIVPDDEELEMEPEWSQKASDLNEQMVQLKDDKALYNDYRKILKDSVPTFDKFSKMKYNDGSEWNKIERKVRTIKELNNKKWSSEFKENTIDLYHKFDKEGFEFSSHSLGRYAQRTDLSVEEAVSILNKPANYIQEDGRKVWFYDGHTFIKNMDETEIVTYVYRKNAKNNWEELL